MGPEGIHFMAVLTAIISIFPVRIPAASSSRDSPSSIRFC